MNKVIAWFDQRLPLLSYIREHLVVYRAPKNLNWMWTFGSLAGIALVVQILTGLFLAMHYKPDANLAFDSIQHIMRDVEWGWLIRYLHAVGASFFFFVVYIHIGRGLYYGSYKSPREVLWWMGLIIFLIMMATAFMGYVLPWGQMSYWGAKVITNLFSVVPFIGEDIVEWLWGGYNVGDPTLNRFYALHFLLPFLIVGVVVLHLWALHHNKSNNPTGVLMKEEKDTVPFHPYYTAKDTAGLGLYLLPFLFFVFYLPDYLGHADNYIPANPLQTPPHIVPEWYFLPFYAILRAIPVKELGVVAMFASILIMFALPWIDRSPIRSGRYRPLFKWTFWVFVLNFLVLGWVGANPPEGQFVTIGRWATTIYFAWFAVLLVLPRFEKIPANLPKGGLVKSIVLALLVALTPGLAFAAEGAVFEKREWSFNQLRAQWEKDRLQRGLAVATQVCMSCHSFKYISHRDLLKVGFTEEEATALAEASGLKLNDKLISALSAEDAAASFGKAPPELSVMTRARAGGEDYVYALLIGYAPEEVPVDFTGQNYNRAFPGHNIAMPPPLFDGLVSYHDGTEATIPQMAEDVTYFMKWAAEPELLYRNKLGVYVLLYVFVFALLALLLKKAVWRDIKKH